MTPPPIHQNQNIENYKRLLESDPLSNELAVTMLINEGYSIGEVVMITEGWNKVKIIDEVYEAIIYYNQFDFTFGIYKDIDFFYFGFFAINRKTKKVTEYENGKISTDRIKQIKRINDFVKPFLL